ncbi:sensor domain-containing protein [Plantactinospora sp. S1510]|uniref:histidine kinase n=1 Tax=Plantactinospora alkalitolerans TaxID=2789879 RepID=A0ABS0GS05_9ACTN|nr:sensor histidine kinase [Plantactinospora alkalitolerans]MBF9128965.1 sensor domain-containing protein [Plantactinospora alkalitolerans]
MRQELRRGAGEFGQLTVGTAIGLAAPFLLALTLVSVPSSLVAGLGIPLFVGAVWLTRRLADLQRHRAAAVLGAPVPSPYAPLSGGVLARTRTMFGDRATWRDLVWLLCQLPVGLLSLALGIGLWLAAAQFLVAPLLRALLPTRTSFDPVVLEITGRSGPLTWLMVPVGVGLVVLAYRLPRHLLAGQARLAGALLGPTSTARLSARVDRLTATRAAAVDASAVELRRVERDLHDGAQVRLVAATLNLGMAEDVIDADPAGAKVLVAEAKAGVGAALMELRDLVRGIHPPVLADRGLTGAVQALALKLTSGIPIELDLRLDRRLAAPVESAAYFVIAESLGNALRHSGATRIQVTVTDRREALHITVRDDGAGGAEPARGSGLRGIQRRLSAFDGSLDITSPPGGPTVLVMELPCGS